MSWLAFALAAAIACLLGRGLLTVTASRPTAAVEAWVFDLAAGLVALHLVLGALQAAGIAWSRPALALTFLPLAALTAGLGRRRDRRRPGRPPTTRPGWGEALAALALAAFTWAAVSLRAVLSDFVWHWGIKGKKDFLAGAVDYAYLGHPWNHFIHPDYPNLVPELYAVTARLAGTFREPPLLLWSALAFAAVLAAVAAILTRAGSSTQTRGAALATVGLGAAAFSLGHPVAGGGDLFITFALLAGSLALLGADEPGAGLRLGVAAAVGAAAKIEGVPLAAILLAAFCTLEVAHRRWRPREVVSAVAVPLAVIVPWFVLAERFHLFQPTNIGAFEPARAGIVAGAVWRVVTMPAWHGLPLVLLLAPFPLLRRRTRLLAAVAFLQLAFYLLVYLTAPFPAPNDLRFYVATSFPRLLLHVVPAAIVALALALDGAMPGHQARPPSETAGDATTATRGPRGPVCA